jgi:rhodanese-related sulfurtransferase
MPSTVTTADVRALLDKGGQPLEVLPASDFEQEHLPGAVNIPLPQLDEQAAGDLDRDRPVIVYCYDAACDLSARGAALLEQFGFAEVYDYTGSKVEWLACGLPVEGTKRAEDRAGALADPAVPTCGPDTPCREALAGDHPVVVVVDDEQVVLGTIRATAADLDVPAHQAMAPGPPTVRPSIDRWQLAESMDQNSEDEILVTTLDGRLVGLVTRERLRAG